MDERGADKSPLLSSDPLGWLSSLATHVLLLIVLATSTLIAPVDSAPVLFSTPPIEEEEPPEDAFRVSDELMVDVGALADGGAGDAAASAPTEALMTDVSLELEPLIDVSKVPSLESAATVLTSPDEDQNLLVRGVGAVGATGSRGAVDRLTGEILLSLAQRPTLVIWLFDRSGSLNKRREEISGRFERVYEELGVVAERGADEFARHEDTPLLTSIAAFGEEIEFLTDEPTDDLQQVQSAVRSIEEDASGQENVFSSIQAAVERHKRYRLRRPRRNVMLVVVTDEAGDDQDQLDRCVDYCRKMQTPVYVVGTPAPFGRQDAYVRYVDPDPQYDQTPQWLPVRQGPESLAPERLRLGAIGQGDFNGPTLDSGFGPYGLARLTAETGGFYIAIHPFRVDAGRARRGSQDMVAEIDYFFDERLMRRYRPDYVPLAEYRRRLNSNAARAALVDAASLSWTAPLGDIRRDFPKRDEAQFVNDLSRAQRAAAVLEPQLERLVTTLQRGERDRPRLESPRWQAGYDLAMGRALAAKVRTEGYNAMLASAKQGMAFTDKKNDTWVLRASKEILTGSLAADEAEAAQTYLNRVIEEHEGTPWAYLAQRELSSPLGWEWKEDFRNLREREQNRNRNRNRNRPEPKERRPPPKL